MKPRDLTLSGGRRRQRWSPLIAVAVLAAVILVLIII